MSVKEIFASIGKYVLIVGIGFGLGIYFEISRYQATDISTEIPESILEENKNKIDSLEAKNLESELLIDSLKDSIQIVETVREIEVSKIQELPVNEAAEFLTLKLREYEKETNQ